MNYLMEAVASEDHMTSGEVIPCVHIFDAEGRRFRIDNLRNPAREIREAQDWFGFDFDELDFARIRRACRTISR